MNENKEVFGAKVGVDTTEAKSKFKELADFIRHFGKQAEEDATIMPKLVDTGYERQIEYVKSQMLEIQDMLKRADAGEEIGKDVLKLQADYETLSYKLEDLLEKQKEFNGEIEETGEQATKTKSVLGEMFDHSISKIKRFTFYLLGARSAFSLFRKYQSIYFQYNNQMQYQTELSQNAIALSLAPAFEFLGNAIAYASIGFAKFIELLTGVNVLSKVTTKGIRDYNKGLKEARTLLTSIDEITNLDISKSSGLGTGIADQYKALADFQNKIKEVEEWFNNSRIGKFIKDTLAPALKKIWEWLGKIWDFIDKHWDVFKYIFGAVALGALVFSIGTKLTGLSTVLGTAQGISVGTGLAGLMGVIKYFATLGAISLAIGIVVTEGWLLVDLISKLKEINKQREEIKEWNYDQLKQWPGIMDVVIDKLKKTKKGTEEWDTQAGYVKETVKGTISSIVNGKLEYEKYKPVIQEIYDKLKLIGDSEFDPELNLLASIIGRTADDKVLLNYLKTGDVNLNLNANATWGQNGTASSGKTTITTVNGKTTTTTSKTPVSSYKIENTQYKSSSQKDLDTAKQLINKTLGWLGVKLATGTNYVPYDNYPALLHKGEAVVPAKYNPAVNNNGNEYTNSLLETLVMKMDDLAKRPNVFEVDGQQFAKATYPLYESEANRQNYTGGVVR